MKTAISLPDELFERVERAVVRSGTTRSAFFAAAATEYLRVNEDEITEQINRVIAQVGPVHDSALAEYNRHRLAEGAEAW